MSISQLISTQRDIYPMLTQLNVIQNVHVHWSNNVYRRYSKLCVSIVSPSFVVSCFPNATISPFLTSTRMVSTGYGNPIDNKNSRGKSHPIGTHLRSSAWPSTALVTINHSILSTFHHHPYISLHPFSIQTISQHCYYTSRMSQSMTANSTTTALPSAQETTSESVKFVGESTEPLSTLNASNTPPMSSDTPVVKNYPIPPGANGWSCYQFYAPSPTPYSSPMPPPISYPPPHQHQFYYPLPPPYSTTTAPNMASFPPSSADGMDKLGSKSAELGSTAESPIRVQLVSTRWNWFHLLFTVITFSLIVFIVVRSSGGGLSGLIENRYKLVEDIPDLSFDDVKGNAEAKEELMDIVEYLRDPEKFNKLGIKVPKGVLLLGPPGTGKTMLARAVAAESGVPFLTTSGSEFEEMLVGVGARRVRQLFETAKSMAPCIIFIDEIDALGSRREDFSSHQRMSLNQLLVEMDGFNPTSGIVVIAATNIGETLDPALIRPGRFDRKVVVELPDPRARKELIDHYLKHKTISPEVRTEVIARAIAGFSGADIETMVNWAAIQAVKRKEPLDMKMLDEAMLNVAMGRERKSLWLNDETRQLCSYHESGHALVALKTEGAREIRRATLIPRGDALGMVNFLSKDGSPLTMQSELLAQMDTCMGGRAAEEIIYGASKVTQGAGSDFDQATRIAKAMVMQMGMSPLLGPIHISSDNRERISNKTLRLIEQEVERLLRESMERAQHILKTHSKELHILSRALLKYETLDVDQIQALLRVGTADESEWDLVIEYKDGERRSMDVKGKHLGNKRTEKPNIVPSETPLTCTPTGQD